MLGLKSFKKEKPAPPVGKMGLAPTPEAVLHTTRKAGPAGDMRRVPRSGRLMQMNSRVAEGFQAEVDKRAAAEGVTRGTMLEMFMASYDELKGGNGDGFMATALGALERIAQAETKARGKLVKAEQVLLDMIANRCEELGLAMQDEPKKARKR